MKIVFHFLKNIFNWQSYFKIKLIKCQNSLKNFKNFKNKKNRIDGVGSNEGGDT